MKFIFDTILALLILTCSKSVYAETFSVQPMYLEFEPGARERTKPFELKVTADKPVTVNISMYKATQQRNGKLGFVELDKKDPDASLVRIRESKHTFSGPGEWKVNGMVEFPSKINRTLLYALMAEEEKAEAKSGIGISVRYAVVLKLQTSNRLTHQNAVFEILGFKRQENNLLLLTELENKSDKDFRSVSFAKIRDQNQKIVATVDLRSESSWQKNEKNSVVFPNSTVEMVGIVGKKLDPGEYSITIYGKLDDKKPISVQKSIVLSKADVDALVAIEEKSGVEMTPKPDNVQFEKGKTKRYRIQLTNFNKEEIIAKMPESQKDNGQYEIEFQPKILNIPAGKSRTVLIKVTNNTSPDLVIKNLKINIYDQENASELQPLQFEIKFKEKE